MILMMKLMTSRRPGRNRHTRPYQAYFTPPLPRTQMRLQPFDHLVPPPDILLRCPPYLAHFLLCFSQFLVEVASDTLG